ncbi:unnamed protein product [Mesocestoides corti]|uniref:Calcineurin-like phosphoesterase domain-containing protein n=1 Tax=Mesocestoides corti TaxID=53468 RepID=A0A0R3UJH5_MESCO|nr:unnamed protein product [Mesocestoides corti]
MVASVTFPKDTTKPGLDTANAKDQRCHQSVLKRGCSSIPEKGSIGDPLMKPACCSLPVKYPRNNQASPPLFNYQNLNVYVVGNVGHPRAQIVRVVHISDTRGVSDYYANGLPNGHILIHSGDFLDGPPVRCRTPHRKDHFRWLRTDGNVASTSASSPPSDDCAWKTKLQAINAFFQHQPHPYKIFVSGCWDYLGPERPSAAQIQEYLPSAIYLEDAGCEILGLKVYGIPWTSADDLRPEDGKSHFTSSTGTAKMKAMLPRWLFSSASWSHRIRQKKRQRCLSSCTRVTAEEGVENKSLGERHCWPAYPSSDAISGSVSSANCGEHCDSQSESISALCDGFVLPDIKAVGERYARVPPDTNIIVSHMPAWRPELYTHVVERIHLKVAGSWLSHVFVGLMDSPLWNHPAKQPNECGSLIGRLLVLSDPPIAPHYSRIMHVRAHARPCKLDPTRHSPLILETLYSRPYLHLCGHDFTGYGVTWRRGVVFSNAAVQLTSSYPRVLPQSTFPRRRKAYSSTFSTGCPSGGDLFAGTSAPSKVTEHSPGVGVTTLPSRIPQLTSCGVRPRRWRRRLSCILGRLSLLVSTHSLADDGPPHSASSTCRRGGGSNRIDPIPSSLAALSVGEGDFVVDPTLSISGVTGTGHVGRRNPLVFDVYVVIEEGVNDRVILPDYTKCASRRTAAPNHRKAHTLRRNTTCSLQ